MDEKITNYFASVAPPVHKRQRTDQETETNQISEQTEATGSSAIEPISATVNDTDDMKLPASASVESEIPDWPTCWTLYQKNDYCSKYDWLYVCKQKLGCSVCQKVGSLGVESKIGMKISKAWAECNITFFGESRQQQLTSLRKKIFDHKDTASHRAAVRLLADADRESLETVILRAQSQEKVTTAKVFRTAYKVAKENQSFHNFETEVDLQELNGVDMGRILHSTNACINIVNHISDEMKKNLVKDIVKSNRKISLIIDESTTVSNVSALIVYVRTCATDTGMNSAVNLFLDLIELQVVTSAGILDSLLGCLHSHGMTEEYLRSKLVCVACDGAAVMLGRKSGLKKLLTERFPSVIFWHCANHRLELAVGDTIKEVSGINRFKAFIDKLYVLYHASPKNSRELQLCAKLLDIQLLKIGRILSTRWVASSFRSVSAVWENYDALVEHFEQAKQCPSKDQKEKCTYEGLWRKITSTEFVLDLGLMCDALQELSELSLDLQDRKLDLYIANQKIKTVVQVFKERQTRPGSYYEMAKIAVENLQFGNSVLHKKDSRNDPPIDPAMFYTKLHESIENRLLDCEDANLAQWARVLDQTQWPDDVQEQLTFGEQEVRNLCRKFQLVERDVIRGFRDYLIERKCSEKLMPLLRALCTIPISSSECERGFSQMNLIATPSRASLLTKTVSSLLFVRLVGPPLKQFDPTKYVDSWILRGRRSAVDKNSKERIRDARLMKI